MTVCAVCGAPVHRRGARYCSYRCAGLARQNYKICVICGGRFPSPPSEAVRTCSRACSTILRRRQAFELGSVDRIAAEREKYVAATAPEDWQTAKIWVLRAPDGKQYTCKNLKLFFRDHADLIDGTPAQAAKGIVVVKRSLLGTRKKGKCYQWKGWTLLDWDDCGVRPRKKAED